MEPRYIAILLIGVVLVFGFIAIQNGNDTGDTLPLSPGQPTVSDTCEDIDNTSERNKCFHDLALDLGDISLCDKIKNFSNLKDECYFDVAIKKNDISLCDKLPETKETDGKIRSECYAEFSNYSNQSESNESPDDAKCDEMADQVTRDKCYLDTAIVEKDPDICESIVGVNTREQCYIKVAQARGDPEICERASELGGGRTQCYLILSKKLQSLELCEKIQDQDAKYICFFEIARIKKDPGICNKTGHMEDICLESLGAK